MLVCVCATCAKAVGPLSTSHSEDDGEVYEEPDEATIAVFLWLLGHYPHIDLFSQPFWNEQNNP